MTKLRNQNMEKTKKKQIQKFLKKKYILVQRHFCFRKITYIKKHT